MVPGSRLPVSGICITLNSVACPPSCLPKLCQSKPLAAEGRGPEGNAGGTTHLLAFSRVSTFFHSSLFSDVNVSTLWGPSRHRLSGSPQT